MRKVFDILVSKAFVADALAKFKQSPLGQQVTATKIVDAAMGSGAAAHIELIVSTGMSHSGNAVMVPCTRTDIHLSAKVGVSANALGQSVGNAEKEIYKKDFTRVESSNDALCKNL